MDQIIDFFTKKTFLAITITLILLAGIAGSVYLVQQQTQLKSRAQNSDYIITVDPSTVQKTSSGQYPTITIKVYATAGWKVYYNNTVGSDCGGICTISEGWSTALGGSDVSPYSFPWNPPSSFTGIHTIALFDANSATILDKDNVTFQQFSGGGTGSGTITVSPTSITQKSDGSWPQLSISVASASTDTWKVLFCEPGVYSTDCTLSSGWSGIKDGSGNSTFSWPPSNNNYTGNHTIALMRWVAGQTPIVWSSSNINFIPYVGGGTSSGTITVSPTSITQKSDTSWPQLSISVSTTSSDSWKVLFYDPGVCGSGCTVSDGWSSIKDGSGNASFTWPTPAGSYKNQHSIAVMRWVTGQTPVIWDQDNVTFTPYSGGGPGPGTGTVSSPQVVGGGSGVSSGSSCLSGTQNNCVWDKVNISVTTSGMNGGILYFHEGECTLTSCGITGWTELARYSSDGSNTKTWTPPAGDVPPGRHTFGLFTPDGSRLVAVDNTDFKEDAAECKSVVFKEGGTQVTTSLVAGKTYDVDITMENKDYQTTSYSGPAWTPGNLSAGTGYFLGFPIVGDRGGGDFFKTNKDTPGTDLSINTLWSVNWPDPAKLRLPLGTNVPANGSYAFKFTVTPQAAGTHTFYWGIVHEGVAWFGGQCTPDITVNPASGGGATPTPTPTPSGATPTPSGSAAPQTGTACYILSETPITGAEDCNNPGKDRKVGQYTDDPTKIPYTFPDPTPGDKLIYVRFVSNSGDHVDKLGRIRLAPNPVLTNISCNYSPSGTGTDISITGTNLGTHAQQGSGGITVGSQKVPVTWINNQSPITAQVDQRLDGEIPITLKTDDGAQATGTCTVGVSTVEFTAITQCRQAGDFTQDNVDVKIFESTSSATQPIIRQKISLDKEGKPQNFTPSVQKGKSYTLIVKAPNTLARKVEFTPQDGTTIIPDPIILPFGDIAPASLPDGKVNSADNSELIRQWSLVEDVDRTGDSNKDKRVNSVDYSCMRPNFIPPNNKDDVFTQTGSGGL